MSGQLLTLCGTFFRFEGVVIGLFFLAAGGLWGVAGLMTLFKQLWAVYLGLVGSYLLLVLFMVIRIASFSPGAVVPMMFFGIAIVQSHRVIGWAKDLLKRGIPLTARP